MTRPRFAYQTLEDRDFHLVEENGPFPCTHAKAWLGSGYYFWDSAIQLAHWWGREGAGYYSGYIICKSQYNLDENRCFNLIDNFEHIDQFRQTHEYLISQRMAVANQTTVARIIEFLRNTTTFKFEATRAYGVNSIGPRSEYSSRVVFKANDSPFTAQYLDALPAIQICFYSKTALDRAGFEIVYPEEYIENYLV